MTYLAELNAYVQSHVSILKNTRLAVFDVDGVLTDGRLYYQGGGEATKVFHVRDGVGIKLLCDIGVEVAIVTAKDSAMVKQRINELGIRHYYPAAKNKLAIVESLSTSLNLEMEECIFIGDDMVDLPVMSRCGASVCPSDAYALVQDSASIVLNVSGGQGVARLVCDILLHAKGLFPSAYDATTKATFERNR